MPQVNVTPLIVAVHPAGVYRLAYPMDAGVWDAYVDMEEALLVPYWRAHITLLVCELRETLACNANLSPPASRNVQWCCVLVANSSPSRAWVPLPNPAQVSPTGRFDMVIQISPAGVELLLLLLDWLDSEDWLLELWLDSEDRLLELWLDAEDSLDKLLLD